MAVSMADLRAEHARRKQDQRAEQEVGTLEASISAVSRDPSINDVSLFERLQRRVGLGDDPVKRRSFFKRLCALHVIHATAVERLIAEVWADSLGARNRGRYFCFVLKKRLVEDGLTPMAVNGGPNDVI